MTDINITKRVNRTRRHIRGRAKIAGTAARPRVTVFKSNKHVFVQFIDDTVGKTLISSKVISGTKSTMKGTKTEKAFAIGTILAKKAKDMGITKVVFDKAGFKYHGRVKAVAEALRAGGITV